MDGIKLLHMSVTIGEEAWYDNSIEKLIQAIEDIHQRVAPEIIFFPEIAFLTYTPIQETYDQLDQFLEHNYFKSMDVFGDEYAVPSLVMKWLSDHKIQLNICPTSNLLLSTVEDYLSHPIRILYDEDVKVTINTDDMLILIRVCRRNFLIYIMQDCLAQRN